MNDSDSALGEPGRRLRARLGQATPLPAIGVYDVFSATLAAREFDALFLSGFSFASSFFGLPDEGFITWTDIVAFTHRLRTVVPNPHLIVDIDDGYGDDQSAALAARQLESAGASGVVLEDQRRPRRCGHVDGKLLLEVDQYRRRLDAVLAARRDLFVVARTDASEPEDIWRRVHSSVEAGADAVLVDGVVDLALLTEIAGSVGVPVVFNQLAGGKSPVLGLKDLEAIGVSMAFYSTVCLFAAQQAVTDALAELRAGDGRLDAISRTVTLQGHQPIVAGNLRAAFGDSPAVVR